MNKQTIKKILCFVPNFPSRDLCIGISSNVFLFAKWSVLFVCMIIKRTFQNHNGLVFNDLHVFKVGEGVKTAKVLCGANTYF